ncbi:hypothetical protein NBE98_05625 [Clostridium swellfunianum]|uniref:hypothetical protein n=1 Tax=Clostridium swellfunianum TaxID=1367462 RepID=UPI00202E2C0B|nr:hypothetical protein [Clostridium swellfunianum]MCM0647855.1 hypothetical protein [Clostridium swellfunianum]
MIKRRPRAYVSTVGITQLHLRNPFIVSFWSIMFPGLGHILINKHIRGTVLFLWEVFINLKSNVNLAILYSFTGRFEMAKGVMHKEWALLYLPTFMFAIWDSYRSTITINNIYRLAAREDCPITPIKFNGMGFNYLDKRSPWVAAAWTALTPGAGQLYLHRIVTAFFVLAWWIATAYFSKLLPCIHYTLLGDFEAARAIVNPHWFLNVPSIYMFAIYDAYANCVEYNNLYDWEQSKFLRTEYQNKFFKLPSIIRRTDKMHIVSTFEYSNYLELAVTEIEMKGIPKENILAVPMDKRQEERRLFDTIHHSDGVSLFDLPMILATLFMIFGAVYGFVLTWGPLLWGLIAMAIGFSIGLIIKLFMTRNELRKQPGLKNTEVVLIIECQENQMYMVQNVLWQHHALGVSKLDL